MSVYIKLQKSVHIEWSFPVKVGATAVTCFPRCARATQRLTSIFFLFLLIP